MMEYSLDVVVRDAIAKGFTQPEVRRLEQAYVAALHEYELSTPRPEPGILSAIQYVTDRFMTAYSASEQLKHRIIDDWHRNEDQADGSK